MGRYEILLNKKVVRPRVPVDTGKIGQDKTISSLFKNVNEYPIADSTSDVIVYCNNKHVEVVNVNGNTGEVVLREVPEPYSVVEIHYSYNSVHCLREKEIFNIRASTSSIFYVSNAPIVKTQKEPGIRRIDSVMAPPEFTIKASEIKIKIDRIIGGDILSTDRSGVLYVERDNPVGEVISVFDGNCRVRLL